MTNHVFRLLVLAAALTAAGPRASSWASAPDGGIAVLGALTTLATGMALVPEEGSSGGPEEWACAEEERSGGDEEESGDQQGLDDSLSTSALVFSSPPASRWLSAGALVVLRDGVRSRPGLARGPPAT